MQYCRRPQVAVGRFGCCQTFGLNRRAVGAYSRDDQGRSAYQGNHEQANNDDRRAIDAVSYLAAKIGRIDDKNSETSQVGGVMLVPGVAKSIEEFTETLAKYREKKELQTSSAK